jgi:hypothetical protein
MIDKTQLNNFYRSGMGFAAQLRLLGEHDLAHYIEVMTLRMKEELENDIKTKTQS